MNYQKSILSLFLLTGSYALSAMDHAAEIGAFVRPGRADGINIGQAYVGIRDARVEHNHVAGEHQYHFEQRMHQEYDPAQPLRRQLFNTLLSGVRQSFFDVGNTGGKFVDYITKIAASVAVGLTIDLGKNVWHRLFDKEQLAQQEAQHALANLATEEALIQSLATQLKTFPRQTESDQETYKVLHARYVSMLKEFSEHATEYMAKSAKTKVA